MVVLPALRSAAVVLERTVESEVADFEAGMIVWICCVEYVNKCWDEDSIPRSDAEQNVCCFVENID